MSPSRTLRRGDAYTATVYTPKPTEAQRRRAGVDDTPDLANYTAVDTQLPGAPGGVRLTFPFFGSTTARSTWAARASARRRTRSRAPA